MVDLIASLSNDKDADIFVYSGLLGRSSANKFIDIVENGKHRNNAILILSTFGGDADAAYIIARYIKRTYDKFTLYVFGYCKSAGTLIALGADEIVMSCRGEFGPLDVQLTKDDEIGHRSSGLDLSQALDSLNEQAFNIFERQLLEIKNRSFGVITTKTAGEIASSMAVGMLAPITSQIDPMKMGEMQRAVNVAYHYGARLNGDPSRVKRLIYDYPTHTFVIDYEEARELFGNVSEPNQIESSLEGHLILSFEQKTGFNCLREPHPTEAIIVCLNPTRYDQKEIGVGKQEKIDESNSKPVHEGNKGKRNGINKSHKEIHS